MHSEKGDPATGNTEVWRRNVRIGGHPTSQKEALRYQKSLAIIQ